jgi:hypothetical protein
MMDIFAQYALMLDEAYKAVRKHNAKKKLQWKRR